MTGVQCLVIRFQLLFCEFCDCKFCNRSKREHFTDKNLDLPQQKIKRYTTQILFNMKPEILKIIVVDNNPEIRELYSAYFESYTDFNLVGSYRSVTEALEDYQNTCPDMIVSEITMPDMCGIEGMELFREKDPSVKIIINSDQSDFEFIKRAFKNGADGYLTKPVSKKRLLRALKSIRNEGAMISSDIAKKVIAMFQRKTYKSFSKRENQIIEHLSQGATYKTIADKLFVTTSAINFHIQNIYLKLDVNSKSEALNKLQELELS